MNDLSHYGTLGMKWGVRRYQPYPKGKHGTFLGQDRDEDIRIKKGTKAYRLQEGDEIKPGQTYVSFDTLDHYSYIAASSATNSGLNVDLKNGEGKSVRLVMDRDIIAPSYKATMDAFIKTVNDVGGPKEFAKDISPELRTKDAERRYTKNLVNQLKNVNVDDALDKAYLEFSASLIRDTKSRSIFYENLKSQGYNAVVDENDKKFGTVFEAPVILFDSSSVKKTGSRAISDADIKYFSDVYWGGGTFQRAQTYKKSKEYWEKFAGQEEKRKAMYE